MRVPASADGIPLPIMPKACLRHDAGRVRGGGLIKKVTAQDFTPPGLPR